jgi:hypothetical protein
VILFLVLPTPRDSLAHYPDLGSDSIHREASPTKAPYRMRYAGQIVTIEADYTILSVYDHPQRLIKTVPRTSHKEVTRHKAYSHTTNRKSARQCHLSTEDDPSPIMWSQTCQRRQRGTGNE